MAWTEAEIDGLAEKHAMASARVDDLRERLEDMRDASVRGRDGFVDLFDAIILQGGSAKKAIASLLAEIARAQMIKGFASLEASGGLFGSLFRGLGSLLGARAGGGPVQAGGAYLVNEQTPNSEVFVASQSGGVLNVPQAQAALRQTVGPQSGGGTVTVIAQHDPGIMVQVIDSRVSNGIGQYDRGLSAKVRQIQSDPWRKPK